jgi:hypothetical protein
MRDLIPAPFIVSLVAQIPPVSIWEQLTISGIGITATIFLWRHFTAKEAEAKKDSDAKFLEREKEDKAERNRLLEIQNTLQSEVIELLKQQRLDACLVAERLEHPTRTIVVNDDYHPVPNKPIK